MKERKCEICGKEKREGDEIWKVFDHWMCSECTDKIRDYIQTTVDIAEQERRRQQKKILLDDVSEFSKIKEGKKDIIRTPREYQVGEVIDISYDGFAYKDSIKCKVIGCYKAASAGYIVELINL